MKKIVSIICALFITTLLFAQTQELRDKVQVQLMLNGRPVIAEAVVVLTFNSAEVYDPYVVIGSGYNACIPQYSEGKLHIPSKVTCKMSLIDDPLECDVREISPVAFRFCNKLTEVEIDEGVTTIGNYAFVGCSQLRALSLPSTLTTIGSGAFCGLKQLAAIKVCATTPPTWQWYDVLQVDGTKNGCHPDLTLYVPNGRQDYYLEAKSNYSWQCMNTSVSPYDWNKTETRSQVGWGSYFNEQHVLTLEDWDQRESISIFDANDLKALRDKVNGGTTYKDYIVTLEADIDLEGEEWTPIGRIYSDGTTNYYDFYGTFDGKGHTIRNFRSTGNNTSEGGHNKGLFGGTRNATVKNLIVENATISGNFYTGVVIAHAMGATTVENVYVKNCTVEGMSSIGGIVGGAVNYSGSDCDLQMRGCVIEGGSVASIYNTYLTNSSDPFWYAAPYRGAAGGLVGYADRAKLTNCANLNTKVWFNKRLVSEQDVANGYDDLLNKSIVRGSLLGYQQNNASDGTSMSQCYALLNADNSLTTIDYNVSGGHNQTLDSNRFYGNGKETGGVTHWNYSESTMSKSDNESALSGLQLQSKLGTAAWGYTDGKLPLPAYFAYTFGDVAADKAAFLPYGTEVEATNYLTLNESGTAYSANSIAIDDNFDTGNIYLPLTTKPITTQNGVSYSRTLSATLTGTQDVTREYPVYLTDDENMPVLDAEGNPVQATNSDGTPKTESVTETVNVYEPRGYTLCLPYDITLTGNCMVYQPTSYNGIDKVVTFTPIDGNAVQAYQPYYVVVTDGEVSLSTYAETTISTGNTYNKIKVGNSGIDYVGTIVKIPNSTLGKDENNYILQSDGLWHKVPKNTPAAYSGAFRAYFQFPVALAGVSSFSMMFEGSYNPGEGSGPNAVQPVIRTIDSDGTERYFDLNGRMLSGKPQKGIYIQNGKKYINK